ncbi:(R,R)-butanediol dehydrogenase / meso-butanediol dehydrogenase / diacetyl reductase [Peptoclostridium litorale DSM 5388]|uniref:(R,R)-butanediol dehydrogenase BdhA n=1 Tax=Peptoclostridium litorale DSM 5388 TaxID=1121324 RepID=A0A069RHY5_PEPLI|nr:2,3-butanediol dehydrogenase [Peptoclostridium litorale]KDR96423.1 (R,R)-butanediol dehydrogenase BdhA [Peptoclostridium litorale DSM 5388]SIN70764.1 (R,R)-butanediol dehydrogenase / meso-butanediol dehydrogenase / diacetyl reductase [Peptoclostridium litorale DSM 5388]
MKAALWYGREDVRVEEVDEPKVVEGSVKIRVKWCGICGSDLHEYLGGPIFIPQDSPHPISGDKAPVILGHEFSGEVVEVGKGVSDIEVGDRVAVEPIVACGECDACKEGKYNLCSSLGFHGLCGGGGGFAEYTVFPAKFVHRIPDSLSFEKAALIEPIAVAIHSLRIGKFMTGQTALVLGAGPIGLATIEALKAAGASLVVVMQRKSIRQDYAVRAGADVVIDPNEVDVAKEVKRLTGGNGVDVSFETTGAKIGFDAGIESIKYNGTMVVTSIWENEININPNVLVFTEKNVIGTIAYRNEFPATISQMSDERIKAQGYITKKIVLDDIVEEGFGTLTGPQKKQHVKIIVTPQKELL